MNNNTFRILGIVILYNPDIKEAYNNILLYKDGIDELIVWDNTTEASLRLVNQRRIESLPNTKYETSGRNEGVSKPLNYAVSVLLKDGYDYLLTMDQDSKWKNFLEYKSICLSLNAPHIGSYAPNINNAFKSNELYTVDHRTITSGMLVPKETFIMVGLYNERFFVDGIDVEFGRRIEKNNLINVRINTAVLYQQYGKALIRKPWGYPAPEYSPFRLHGILSSHVWMMRNYKLPLNIVYEIIFIYFFRYIFDILFYQDDKKKKVFSIIRGIIDGLK